MNNNYEISSYILEKKKKIFFGFFFFHERIVADPFILIIKVCDVENLIKIFVKKKLKMIFFMFILSVSI
jgi:hypothetical protein